MYFAYFVWMANYTIYTVVLCFVICLFSHFVAIQIVDNEQKIGWMNKIEIYYLCVFIFYI